METHLPPRVATAILFALLSISACQEREEGAAAAVSSSGNFAVASAGWLRGDFHFHTNYSEDAKRQGGDDLGPALDIADAYRDPLYLAAHPEHAGDGLDFVVVTDHRTDLPLRDGALRHPHLIVVPGEEYGGSGHATIAGLTEHIPHEREPGETQDQHHRRAIEAAHAQGAIFSPNHSCQPNRWGWTMDGIDALEVWNAPWSAFWAESTLADLDADLAEHGVENEYIRGAISRRGFGSNAQALFLWYGLLARGKHVAPIGGGDRHMVVGAGLPTTYVHAPGLVGFERVPQRQLGVRAILDGVRQRGTFISRSPHGPQIGLVAVDPSGRVVELGGKVTAGFTYTVRARVGRAKGGVLRLVGGPLLPGSGPVTARFETLHEVSIPSRYHETSWTWRVPDGGGWLHAIVLEPRLTDDATPETRALAESFAALPTGDSLVLSIARLLPLIDPDILLDASRCTTATWTPGKAKCMPSDKASGGTFYMPDEIERLINTYFEDGVVTPWSMGALSAAFLSLPR